MPSNKSCPSRRPSTYCPSLERLEERDLPSGFAFALGNEGLSNGKSTVLDAAGNIYVAGEFPNTVDFDPGSLERNLTSAGADDFFVAKYSPTGSFEWARRIGGPTGDSQIGGGAFGYMTIGSDGTIVFSTPFSATTNITGINNDGSLYSYPNTVTAVGSSDGLVGAIDSEGTVLWTQTMGGAGAILRPRPVSAGPDGSILIAGSFTGTVDFDPATSYGDNRDVLTSAGYEDIYITKLDIDGSFVWATRVGGTAYESAMLSIDTVGNAYLSGAFNSRTLTVGSQTLTRRGNGFDTFVSKLDVTTGGFVWTQQIGGEGNDVAYAGLAAYHDPNEANPNLGNVVYISGELRAGVGPVTFGETSQTLTRTTGIDAYIAKVNGDGTFEWVRQIQGWNDETMHFLATDSAGNVYANVTLMGNSVTDVDPGPGEVLVAVRPGTTTDGHLVKLDVDGNFLWDRAEGRLIRPIVGPDGAVYATGSYNAATADFDTGSGSVTLPNPVDGLPDFFLLKIDQHSLGAVFGKVIYANGYPAEGATITLKQNGTIVASTTTGSFGEFDFRYLATGAYTAEALGSSRSFTLATSGQFATGQNIVLPMPAENTKFYVVNDSGSDRTYQYGATGSTNANTALAAGNTAPRGATSNQQGTRVWVADANNSVYVYNSNGTLLGSWSASGLPKNADVQGIATNGTDIWLLTASSKQGDKVYKFAGAADRLSGSQKSASNFALSSTNANPTGITTDGTSFWVVDDSTTDRVFKYTLTGSYLGYWTIDSANSSPTGITINPNDVRDLWIVDNGALKVFQYSDATSRTSGTQLADRMFALAAGNTNPQGIADPPTLDASFISIPSWNDVGAAQVPDEHDDTLWRGVADSTTSDQLALNARTKPQDRHYADIFTLADLDFLHDEEDDAKAARKFPNRDENLMHEPEYVGKAESVPLPELNETALKTAFDPVSKRVLNSNELFEAPLIVAQNS